MLERKRRAGPVSGPYDHLPQHAPEMRESVMAMMRERYGPKRRARWAEWCEEWVHRDFRSAPLMFSASELRLTRD